MSMRRQQHYNIAPDGRPTAGEGDEYTFRFPISRRPGANHLNLREMLGFHLREILDLLTLTQHGKEVNVDGFSLLNNPDVINQLYRSGDPEKSESDDPIDIYEPRIRYVQRIIESLLAVVDFECNGQKVNVDGIRLKKPEQWLSPSGGAADVLAHAATRCNLKCRFCYNAGSPPALKPRAGDPDEEYREVMTRIEHYVPDSRLNIFPDMGSPCESLTHPRISDILAVLRSKTREPIRISTNGSLLTTAMIQTLASHQPVFLDISLNSSSPTRRRWLMNDPKPQVAIESLARLKAMRIPYSVVIVPWPFPSLDIMVDDLRNTVSFAADHDPAFFQISLPGYSRFFSEKPLFDQKRVWNEVKETVQELRRETECPLILRPGLFEEYTEPEAVNTAYVAGVIKNSPLARACLRGGDKILKLNGLPVRTRPQARSLLTMLRRSDLLQSSVIVLRDGEELRLDLNPKDFDYPYDPHTGSQMGVVFASSGIPREWIERLRLLISQRKVRNVLLLTSRLVRPVLEKMIREHFAVEDVSLHLRVPENRYFGGNIFMGDLLVVEDFIAAAREFQAEGKPRPDLILIPSSPFHMSGWGRDLTGRVYKEVERELGIPVALVECDPIFD